MAAIVRSLLGLNGSVVGTSTDNINNEDIKELAANVSAGLDKSHRVSHHLADMEEGNIGVVFPEWLGALDDDSVSNMSIDDDKHRDSPERDDILDMFGSSSPPTRRLASDHYIRFPEEEDVDEVSTPLTIVPMGKLSAESQLLEAKEAFRQRIEGSFYYSSDELSDSNTIPPTPKFSPQTPRTQKKLSKFVEPPPTPGFNIKNSEEPTKKAAVPAWDGCYYSHEEEGGYIEGFDFSRRESVESYGESDDHHLAMNTTENSKEEPETCQAKTKSDSEKDSESRERFQSCETVEPTSIKHTTSLGWDGCFY
eukprot:m.45386 g.45386  ORF g.45386 m.45386 type:complete len:309 (-) comp10241_c0_seq1:1268-2194(-)